MHPRRLTRSGLLITLLGLLATLLVQAPTAQASSTILCKGFTACEKAGYSSFGYGPSNYKKMWWRMYSGHNCTNYMAYRMIKAGLPTERPWSGSGDARNWGVVFKSKTDQTPMVGSVAWWSSNHVAYVQQIVDANTIIISEDHYRGDFDWRRITRSGGGWPTGFIHLADEAVAVTTPPAITGTPKVDQPLVVKPGAWNRSGASYKYQWYSRGKAIPAATAATYTPGPDQVGDDFLVKVTATKAGFKPGTAATPVTRRTAPGTLQGSGVPVVSGIPKVGAVLTATVPAVSPEPDTRTYAWLADGKPVPGAAGTKITLKPAQLGKEIEFVVTSGRAGYDSLSLRSAATDEVGPEKFTVEKEPALAPGRPHPGKPYAVVPGAVSPTATTSYQWYADKTAIRGATRSSYTPTAADLQTRLTVKVSYSRPGYTTVIRLLTAKKLVRSEARIRVASHAHKTVTVRVLADGVPAARGQVRLTAKDGSHRTLTLKDGRITFSSSWIRKGTRTYIVEFLGSPKVLPGSRTVTLAVK